MNKDNWYKLVFILLRPIGALVFPFRTVGREKLPEGAAVVCASHSNSPDPILLSFAMGIRHPVSYFAKAEARKIPVVGTVMTKLGTIFVHRGEQDLEAIKGCVRALRAGNKVLIFPEGTRVHGEDKVEPKSGAIHIAAKLGVPIVPAYIPRDKKPFRRFKIVFGEPYIVEVQSHADYEALAAELMDKIWALKDE